MYIFSQFLIDCSKAKVSTIVLCQRFKFQAETVETMVRDAITFVNNVMKGEVVAGGGATEMQISEKLRDYAQRDSNREVKPLIEAIGNALEIIPRQLCENYVKSITQSVSVEKYIGFKMEFYMEFFYSTIFRQQIIWC